MNPALPILVSLMAGANQPQEVAAAPRPPDIAIVAYVRAKELRFSVVPDDAAITARGSVNGVPAATVSTTDRENLPARVEPNVVYRDVGIRLTITSTLPDIEKILDEVLGPESRTTPDESTEGGPR